MKAEHEPEPRYSRVASARTSFVDRLLFSIWAAALTAFLIWLIAWGVNV